MKPRYTIFAILAVTVLAAGCGSGQRANSPELTERRIDDLMRNVGLAVIYQNWYMLASLHGTESRPAPESLAATFADALTSVGTLSHVVEVKALDGGAYAVTVGTDADSNATNFQGITITAVPEEVSGHYVVRNLALGS